MKKLSQQIKEALLGGKKLKHAKLAKTFGDLKEGDTIIWSNAVNHFVPSVRKISSIKNIENKLLRVITDDNHNERNETCDIVISFTTGATFSLTSTSRWFARNIGEELGYIIAMDESEFEAALKINGLK